MATHITARGAKRLAEELQRLTSQERPQVVREVADAAAQGDRSENAEYIYGKKRLREIDRRIRYLMKRLDDCVVVDVLRIPERKEQVFFAAIVTVEDENGVRRTYQLVGPDEAQPEQGLLSYRSPLGAILMHKRQGDVVLFKRPAGEIELEIVEVAYGRRLDMD